MPKAIKVEIASYFLAALGLFLVLELGLLSALLAGLLVYHLVEFGSVRLGRIGVLPEIGRVILLVLIIGMVVAAIALGIVGLVSHLTAGPDSLGILMHKMADVVDTARAHLPAWVDDYVPSGLGEWQTAAAGWLRENAKNLSAMGRDAGVLVARLVIGMVIGGLIALNAGKKQTSKPLASALDARVRALAESFRRIVFSQIRISTVNTILTATYLGIILPLCGTPLPLSKTMIAVTFIAGLLPIIGNLISNTMIVLVALSVSAGAAIGSLVFLVVIHKFEYFMNAHIVGSQISARAWELLIAMLIMEAAFGVPGLVAAPIYYAYLKDELASEGLV